MELIFFIVFGGIILFTILSKKGRKGTVHLIYGEIIQDYGDIDSIRIKKLITQTLHLYKCSNQGESFFILEIRNSAILSYYISHIKITTETAEKMVKVFSE